MKKEPSKEFINKAREGYDKFSGIDIKHLTRSDREFFVGFFYPTLKSKTSAPESGEESSKLIPLSEVPDKRLYAVSISTYERMNEVISKYGANEEEGAIIENLNNLEKIFSEGKVQNDKVPDLIERLGIQTENLLFCDPLLKRTEELIKKNMPYKKDDYVPF